jgi:hypothetical protein
MNRKKKKQAREHEVTTTARQHSKIPKGSKHEYICEGCEKVDKFDYCCTVYRFVPDYYLRVGSCAFNQATNKAKSKAKVRVGQQKGKSQRVR